ncbi:MAG: leucine-rich repeat domain-containing protein [Clostridia bacterium]|nr:leucine-rich repeat domain-containing protein [Clostridia bacterium]MDY4083620.1 leucine-rich repeat domain-containing protein [Eubacteriales bacterium]
MKKKLCLIVVMVLLLTSTTIFAAACDGWGKSSDSELYDASDCLAFIRAGKGYAVKGFDYEELEPYISAVVEIVKHKIVIPEEYKGKPVIAILDSAFETDKLLVSVTIPSTVKSIGECAFAGCASLEEIKIPKSVNSIGEFAFAQCSSLKKIEVDKDNQFYSSKGNCLIEDETSTMIAGCKNSKIPNDGSVKLLAEAVFYGVTPSEITIPKSVTTIAESTFLCCIGLKKVVIEEGTTTICFGAFNTCIDLESVTLPSSIKNIDGAAFSFCNSLDTIEYKGTKSQWKKISKEYRWILGSNEITVKCSDGEITIDPATEWN